MRAQLIAVVLALLVISVPVAFAQGWDGGDHLWDAQDVEATPTQSWFGGTGMIVIPTADVLPHKDLNAHIHAIDVDRVDEWETVWGVTTSIYPGVEIGATDLSGAFTGTGRGKLVYHAKVGANLDDLLKTGPESPDIAVGGRDVTDEIDELWYVVLSKDFEVDATPGSTVGVSLGLGNSGLDNSPLDGFFFGVDFTPFQYARMQIEHDSENVNASLRYWWSDWAVTEIGVLDGQLGGGFTAHTGW
ncbi:MAG: hypothetical protein ACOCX2_10580 [Armatimonadota bacterium]